MSRVRTRFAPSPTGRLHLGNARTAVLNWLVARHHDGLFVLRIEDTDAERNVAGSEAELVADLRWLGLDWDEGPGATDGQEGPHAPYRQSERGELYRRQAAALLDGGHAYRCFCSAQQLEAERTRALEAGRSPRYRGTCRAVEPRHASERAEAGHPYVIRLATPDAGEVVVRDEIRGTVVFDAAEIGDFVLVRSDGVPTYNFAVVVDDAEMAITHVIRGAGHLSNTPYQVLVYGALGLDPPAFAHAPTVLGPDRKKLSKRTGAPTLRELREKGVHPDAVVNYLSLLGWSSPSGDEILDRERLIEEVSLDRVGAADVVFDPDKLRWLSARHIDAMSTDALAAATRPVVEAAGYDELLDGRLPKVLEAVRTHLDAFSGLTEHLAPFVGRMNGEGRERADRLARDRTAVGVLNEIRRTLAELNRWDAETIQGALRTAGGAMGVTGRELYIPLRVALTGEEHGPPLATVLEVQGRERVLSGLDRVLTAAGVAE